MISRKLRILHTNDLHSQLENWAAVTSLLKKKKVAAEVNGEDILLFDIGDHSDRVHSITEGLQGRGNVQLLNKMGYDAVTIGNNEGITFSKEALDELYEDANFPVILSNLFETNGKLPHWCNEYKILTTSSGIRIGVTGVTIPYKQFYKTLGWDIQDPFKILEPILKVLRPKVDILICLSHLGLYDDEKMAEFFPELDIILGSHTHHVLHEGEKVNGTWINQAGRSGKYIGEIIVEINKTKTDNNLIVESVRSIEVDLLQTDKDTEKDLSRLYIEANSQLEKNLLFLKNDLDIDWYKPTPLSNMLAEGLREWCDADVSMVNSGVLLDSLKCGEITYKDIHRICPHPINPALVIIRGEKLLEIIRQAKKKEMIDFALKGFGFRGKILGEMIFDGLSIHSTSSFIKDEDVIIGGEPLQRSENYRLATLDMFTLGNIYPAISSIKEKKYFMPEFLRDILAWKLKHTHS
ncbi:bifunctional UDP-sugar hydrolase/5'-nucleotidase [Evansella sp. AB-rgal1]|uniref:bifunctional metallophosphatase/5'-nucleotidase n=1 Tax=Evansella sp. AB-rgal1 TaxID=3242696 RepID=UPI00359CEBBE